MRKAGDIGIGRSEPIKPEEPGQKSVNAVPQALLSAVWDAVVYLDKMSEFGPGWAKLEERERLGYVIGYAAPLHEAGVNPVDVMPAARRYLTVHQAYPRAPYKMIEFAGIVRSERLRRENDSAPALEHRNDEPPVSAETRRAVKERLGWFD